MSDRSDFETTKRRVTLKDIALKLNVSHATVSRALNRVSDPLISEATRQRVRQTALELGYRPNQAARNLATGRTGLVCLWLWSEGLQTSYHALVSRLFQLEMQRLRYQMLIDPVGGATLDLPLASGFDPWSVDGIIAHESSPALLSLFGGAGRAPVPVVATGSYHLVPDVDQVILDVSPGSFAAMRHLIDIGRRNIVYLAHDLVHQAQDPRYAAFHQLAAEAGLPPRATNVPSLRGDVRSFVRQYVQETGMPDALFCHNDDIAIAASRALCDLGVKIPDDVAVVGCDGIEETEYLEVPITTVVLPLQQMAKAACECLASRIQDPSIPIREMRLTSELVIRQSTTGIPDKWS